MHDPDMARDPTNTLNSMPFVDRLYLTDMIMNIAFGMGIANYMLADYFRE